MSQSAPGWYQDHDDPRLARWWDGEHWTEHTLVLADQDWSTEPAPPTDAGTRFPVDPSQDTAVESAPPARYEEDIYAPIRDPWGDEPDEPAEPATTAWTGSDTEWSGAAAGAAAGAGVGLGASDLSTGWDDERWPTGSSRRRGGLADSVQTWPSWARVAVPLAVVLVIVVAIAAVSGAFSGDDGGVKADATTSTTQPSLSASAAVALQAAGNGPFTSSTFTTLIQAACEAAQQNDPTALTQRIALLGYDASTTSKLMDGLEAGTAKYCPDDMAGAPTLLNQVRNDATGGTTTTSSSVPISVPEVTSSTVKTTSTTKKPKPTSTTVKPTTTSTAPTTTSTAPTTTSTSTPPSSTTTSTPASTDGGTTGP